MPSFVGYTFLDYLVAIIDIFLVWIVIYKLLITIRGTKAITIVQGILVVLLVKLTSNYFNFHTLEWITDQLLLWGFLAIIIIFQPELRRALEQLGRANFFKSSFKNEDETVRDIEEIKKAVDYLAKRRIGALISLEKETGLNEYIETGTEIGGKISAPLLINLFIPNSPLHDGAVIIVNHQVSAAGCYFPLSESNLISKELGTRHRAAIGISEVTDCITLVVSEESGGISLTKNGELYRGISVDEVKSMLEKEFVNQVKPIKTPSWKWRSKKNE